MKKKTLQAVDEVLEYAIKHIKKENFVKAKPTAQETSELIDVIHELCAIKKPDEDEKALARKILKIANSFYTFSEGEESEGNTMGLRLIPDEIYDVLVKKYGADGAYDGAYVPKDLEKKTSEYQELTSNLNKAYVFTDDEDIPDGVKESTSVGGWIKECYKELDLDKDEEIEIEATPKIDGVSAHAEKNKKNEFNMPLTRGSVGSAGKKKGVEESVVIRGLEGKLENILIGTMAEKLPKEVSDSKFAISWEIFVTEEGRKALEKVLGDAGEYKTLRNAASGSVNRLFRNKNNIADQIVPHLSFYPIITSGLDMKHRDMRKMLLEHFAKVPKDMIEPKYFKGKRSEVIKEMQAYAEELFDKRNDLSYDIDGVVFTIVKRDYQKKLGREGRKNNYQLAYKFNPNFGIGIASHSSMMIGDFGQVTRKLVFKRPVVIQGVAYPDARFAANGDFETLSPRTGSEVKIIRTGDAIPAIAVKESLELKQGNGQPILLSPRCIHCGTLITNVGKIEICPNEECKGRIQGKIMNIIKVINVAGAAEGFASRAYEIGVRNVLDLYNLTVEDYQKMGYVSAARKLYKDIQEGIENLGEDGLIDALGIKQLRTQTAQIILGCVSMQDIFTLKEGELLDRVKSIRGIDKKAIDFVNGLKEHQPILEKLIEKIHPSAYDGSKPLICFSGLRPSKADEKKLKEYGYKVTDSKSKFDILVTDKTSGSKYESYLKNQDTKRLLSEAQFEEFLKSGILPDKEK